MLSLPTVFAIDLSHLLAPLSLIIFGLLTDIGTRLMVPAVRDCMGPLLGIPQTIWRWLREKLARANRTSRELQKRGVLALLVMIAAGVALAMGLQGVARFNRYSVYAIWCIVWNWSVAWTLARDILFLPTPTANAYTIIQTRRLNLDAVPVPPQADPATLYRTAIITMGSGLVAGLAAPLFYALLFALCRQPAIDGAVLGVIAGVVKTPLHADMTRRLYNRPANAVAQLLLFVPGRLIALIMLVGTLFTPKAKTLTALKIMVKQGHLCPDPSAGWVMAVISGALDIALPLGRADQAGTPHWLGGPKATAQIARGAVQRVVWLHAVTILILMLILCATLLLSM